MKLYCRSCSAVFDESEAVSQQTDIPCPCGCENNLIVLLCPNCYSDDVTVVTCQMS